MTLLKNFPFNHFKFNSDHIFKELSSSELELLNSKTRTRIYKKKQVIFFEDSPATGVYYIKKGLVKKYKTGSDGKEQIFYVSKTADLIGYHAVLSNENYYDSAAAMEDSEITFIPKDVFAWLIAQVPKLPTILLKNISHEFGVLVNTVTVMSQLSVRERLALQLILLKEKFKDSSTANKSEIRISRTDLASLVGTSIETIIRLLHEFKESGIIEAKGKTIIITNINKLIKVSNYNISNRLWY